MHRSDSARLRFLNIRAVEIIALTRDQRSVIVDQNEISSSENKVYFGVLNSNLVAKIN